MRVTVKGQVTIPQRIRRRLGITPGAEVAFEQEGDRAYLVKVAGGSAARFRRLRGIATVKMSTDQIMQLTRGER